MMVPLWPTCFSLVALLSGLAGVPAQEPATPADEGRIGVEIRGKLLRSSAEGQPQDSPQGYQIQAQGVTFPLEFRGKPPAPDKLKTLTDQMVVVRGTLERREGTDQFTCVVEGDVDAANAREYLVGYKEGQVDAVEALAKELGLAVRSRYEPGKYLVVLTTERADPNAVDRLKKSPSVRFVEPNQTYSIRGGQTPPRSRPPR